MANDLSILLRYMDEQTKRALLFNYSVRPYRVLMTDYTTGLSLCVIRHPGLTVCASYEWVPTRQVEVS